MVVYRKGVTNTPEFLSAYGDADKHDARNDLSLPFFVESQLNKNGAIAQNKGAWLTSIVSIEY